MSKEKVVFAKQGEIGKRYLSKAGIPLVIKAEASHGKVTVLVESVNHEIRIPEGSLLFPYDAEKVSQDAKDAARWYGVRDGGVPAAPKVGSDAAKIDEMLFAGGKSVMEIAKIILGTKEFEKRKWPGASVYSRVRSLEKIGYKAERSKEGHIKLIKGAK